MANTPANRHTIPHQKKVEDLIDARLGDYEVPGDSDFVEKVGGTIADPASPGSSYVQAEVVALRTALVAILDKLRESGLIDEA